MPKHRIDVYSAGCPTCQDTIDMVRRVAGPEDEVRVHDMKQADTAARAKSLGVRSVPAIAVNGKLAGCCAGRGPNEEVLREALH